MFRGLKHTVQYRVGVIIVANALLFVASTAIKRKEIEKQKRTNYIETIKHGLW